LARQWYLKPQRYWPVVVKLEGPMGASLESLSAAIVPSFWEFGESLFQWAS